MTSFVRSLPFLLLKGKFQTCKEFLSGESNIFGVRGDFLVLVPGYLDLVRTVNAQLTFNTSPVGVREPL